jgi:hypothetical protein
MNNHFETITSSPWRAIIIFQTFSFKAWCFSYSFYYSKVYVPYFSPRSKAHYWSFRAFLFSGSISHCCSGYTLCCVHFWWHFSVSLISLLEWSKSHESNIIQGTNTTDKDGRRLKATRPRLHFIACIYLYKLRIPVLRLSCNVLSQSKFIRSKTSYNFVT